jgi:hypothetical protein
MCYESLFEALPKNQTSETAGLSMVRPDISVGGASSSTTMRMIRDTCSW